jgi:Protein of unknown function (DUF4089)
MTKRAKSLTKGKSNTSRAKTSRAKTSRVKTSRVKTLRVRPARRARAKTTRVKRKPAAPNQLDTFIDAAVQALNLPLEPAWKGAIKANLDVTLRLAAVFADFPLPDDAEPAPVFVA